MKIFAQKKLLLSCELSFLFVNNKSFFFYMSVINIFSKINFLFIWVVSKLLINRTHAYDQTKRGKPKKKWFEAASSSSTFVGTSLCLLRFGVVSLLMLMLLWLFDWWNTLKNKYAAVKLDFRWLEDFVNKLFVNYMIGSLSKSTINNL